MPRWMKSLALCWVLLGAGLAVCAAEPAPLRIGLTSVFLDDQTSFISAWRDYLERRLQRKVVFVQRANYREIIALLRSDKLDFAWVCGYPYFVNRRYLSLLAVPLYEGKPTYRSYLIVPATDVRTKSIGELRDKVFAFSDPDSNSGYLVPVHDLHALQERASVFFGKTFFTWSHRKVVEAVAAGVAQAGAVDGYVWDMLARQHPELTVHTRVAQKSAAFGFPPFVAAKTVPAADLAAMREVLFKMAQDPDAEILLWQLGLDGFVKGDDALYAAIGKMMRAVAAR